MANLFSGILLKAMIAASLAAFCSLVLVGPLIASINA
jgi:hypothetical protein